jgi:hypothetical protein
MGRRIRDNGFQWSNSDATSGKSKAFTFGIVNRLEFALNGQLCRGQKVRLFVFAFFTPAITPPFAAHWSDTEPIVGSEIKNRASVSL